MKKIYSFLLLLAPQVAALTSCENDDYLYKDDAKIWLSGDADQEAKTDSVFYSFKLYNSSVTETKLNLIVNLTGDAVDYDRKIGLQIVDTLTNVSRSDYSYETPILPAGQFKVTIPVTVKRKTSSLDITKNIARVTFRVTDTEDLKCGVADRQEYRISWCDYLIKPSSWGNIQYYIGPFSQARFKFIIDFAGYTDFEEFSGDYNKIIGLQGLLIKLLKDYNADPANAGREEGWPYKNDNGEPLAFGQGLSV